VGPAETVWVAELQPHIANAPASIKTRTEFPWVSDISFTRTVLLSDYRVLRFTIGIMAETNDPRYPIGKFTPPELISTEDRRYAIVTIAEMPELLREALRDLDAEQMSSPYREGGWTVRQLVHHIADSHMTAFHRLRKALTEDWPVVTGYDEKAFAMLADITAPAEWSLEIIESVHARWVMLLQSLTEDQWHRGFKHQERGPMALDFATLLYAWHSQHHVAHITALRKRQGW